MGGEGFQSYLAAGLLLAGVMDDLRSRKVHNALIIFCFSLSCIAVLFIPNQSILEPAKSFAFAFALGFPLWLFRVIGGGDFKLMAAISPLIAFDNVFSFFVFSLVWGAILGLIMAGLDKKLPQMYNNIFATVLHRKGVADRHLQKVPFTVAILLGFLSVSYPLWVAR